MKTFKLVRYEDPTGISGTGEVAEGVVFSNGKVVVGWDPAKTIAKVTSVVVMESIEDVEKLHGHGGATEIVWDE